MTFANSLENVIYGAKVRKGLPSTPLGRRLKLLYSGKLV